MRKRARRCATDGFVGGATWPEAVSDKTIIARVATACGRDRAGADPAQRYAGWGRAAAGLAIAAEGQRAPIHHRRGSAWVPVPYDFLN